MSEIDQKQAHLMETTEATLLRTSEMLRQADAKLAEARMRHDTADILLDTARATRLRAEENLSRAERLRNASLAWTATVLLLAVLLATHVI